MRRPALHLLTVFVLLANLLLTPWRVAWTTPQDSGQPVAAMAHCDGHAPALPDSDHHSSACCDQDHGCSCGCALPMVLRQVEALLPACLPVRLRAVLPAEVTMSHADTPPFRPPADHRALS